MNLPYIAGKYSLLRKIASGGMAEIFLAKHVGMDGFEKLVVLKRILPHLASQREYVRMFLDEAKTAADLRHSNVVNTFEFGEDKGVHFMVMEFLHGQDLRSIYRKALLAKIKVPLQHSLGIIIDVCCGLNYAHAKKDLNGKSLGIVHRDISPQNIIVTYEGETKIVDFGIAKAAHQNVETSTGVLKGKYSYMSPEQAMGHVADHRTDIFALGIVLYEMTTFRRLFKRENEVKTLQAVTNCEIILPKDLIPDYPVELQVIVMKALAREKEHRFSNCEELRLVLDEFLFKNQLSYSSSRMRQFMRELFKESIEKEKALGTVDLNEVSDASFWTSTEEGSTVSTRVELFQRQPRLLFAVSIGLGIALALIVLVLSTKDFEKSMLENSSVPAYEVKNRENLNWDNIFSPIHAEKENEEKFQVSNKPAKKLEGRLKIVVNPWAEVYLDGIKIGSTPLSARKLPEGTYQIRLENPNLKKVVNKTITIASGKDTLIKHSW